MSAGGNLLCLLREGAAFCWGDTELGSPGNGSDEVSPTPQSVSGVEAGVTEISDQRGHLRATLVSCSHVCVRTFDFFTSHVDSA